MWLLEMQRANLLNIIKCTTDLNIDFDIRSSNGSGCSCGCGRRKKKQGSYGKFTLVLCHPAMK
jgi:hypothetical protein